MVDQKSVSILLIADTGALAKRIVALLAQARPAWQVRHESCTPTTESAVAGVPCDVILLAVGAEGEREPIEAARLEVEEVEVAHRRWPDRPIIVLGPGGDSDALIRRVQEHGAVDYVPFAELDNTVLVRAIGYAVRRVADLRQMWLALDEEQSLVRSVIDTLPDHIYVKDTRHRFTLTNIATQRFFGLSAEILHGKSDFDVLPPDAAASFQWEEDQVMKSGQPRLNREEHIVSRDGEERWTLTTKVPLRDQAGKIIGLVGINRDITVRKSAIQKLEQTNAKLALRELELLQAMEDLKSSHEALQAIQLQLMQVEKMESVGRLAAGIAHEVKNPLAIISTGLDFLSHSSMARESDAGRALASMGRAIKRADSVIRGLLDFSAPAVLRAVPCDLNAVIRQALLLVDHELMRCKITLTVDLADQLPAVSIDAIKVEQVFINLVMNAIHAMPNGGAMTLRTRKEQVAALGHNIGDHRAERFRAGEVVVLAEVDDTGHGIPDDKLAKVFDPFFTTKPTGKGTGLGLSVARTIVDLHGGMLQLANRPEGGVRASLLLKAIGEVPHDHAQSTGSDCTPIDDPACPHPVLVDGGQAH